MHNGPRQRVYQISVSLEPSQNTPTHYLNYGRDAHSFASVQLITGAKPIVENIACESSRNPVYDSRRTVDGVPVSDLSFYRKTIGDLLEEEQGRANTVVVGS